MRKAQSKIFFQKEEVRKLRSGMLMSNTLQEIEEQKRIKAELDLVERQREEEHHRRLVEQKEAAEREEERKRAESKRRKEENAKDIHKQHREFKKKFIKQLKEDKMEGQMIKRQAE